MPKASIGVVWERIAAHADEEFTTKTGLPFTYSLQGGSLTTSRTDYPLSKNDFAQALKEVPLDGPGRINDAVRGPAYIWAILHDKRIRGSEW